MKRSCTSQSPLVALCGEEIRVILAAGSRLGGLAPLRSLGALRLVPPLHELLHERRVEPGSVLQLFELGAGWRRFPLQSGVAALVAVELLTQALAPRLAYFRRLGLGGEDLARLALRAPALLGGPSLRTVIMPRVAALRALLPLPPPPPPPPPSNF